MDLSASLVRQKAQSSTRILPTYTTASSLPCKQGMNNPYITADFYSPLSRRLGEIIQSIMSVIKYCAGLVGWLWLVVVVVVKSWEERAGRRRKGGRNLGRQARSLQWWWWR